MLRVSKLADYGIVIMCYIAADADRQPITARRLAAESELPLPTVAKILKALCRAGLLVSHRGGSGGYSLGRSKGKVSVADVISAIDGPIALIDCDLDTPRPCDIKAACPVGANWKIISRVLREALERLTLDSMTQPMPTCLARVRPHRRRGRGRTPILTLVKGAG